MFRTASARLATLISTALLTLVPSLAQAQKALVYCPIGIDATGCNTVVAALVGDAARFPGGADAGYDGTQGTVDLASADFSAYAVFLVPSLADGPDVQPYALLRNGTIAARLKAAFMGRAAVWSGTPDVGSTNRAAKNELIRNLAGWARADSAGTHGPGVVVLQDNSDSPAARYGWLGGISALSMAADTTFEVYSNVQVLTATGRTILTNSGGLQIGYTNMASYGLVRGTDGSAATDEALGGRTARVVLVTAAGDPSDPNIATVRTDKEDYQPGDTVTVTGSGWEPGETVSLLFHEDVDPPIHPDKSLSALADSLGHIFNRQYEIDSTDLGVRFTLTATGQTSGRTAQATFTDATHLRDVTVLGSQSTNPVVAGSSTTYGTTAATSVQIRFNGNGTCIVTLTALGLPSGATATFAPSSLTSNSTQALFSLLTVNTTAATAAGTTTFTVKATGTGGGTNDCATTESMSTPGLGSNPVLVVVQANQAPVLGAIGNKTVNELATLSFTATATDADTPAQTLTFSLDAGAPSGASITAAGAFSWTPTEAQGPGDYPVTVRVTDSGSPAMSDFETISIHVNEVNVAPVLAAIGNKTVNEGTALTFTATATDADLPANTLTFSLVGAPVGASINASTGAFSWTPTEAQGPGDFTFTVKVTDNGSPVLSDDESITVHVNEVNTAPVLTGVPTSLTTDELVAVGFDADATDGDTPAQTLTFSLVSGPLGATIDPGTGVFAWTPTESQGPGSYPFQVQVSDGVTTTSSPITITVNEVNVAPVLAAIGNKTADEETALTFTATATDADLPANSLAYSLTGTVPAGATINASSGVFTWTPTEAQGPGSYTFTVKVADNGTPALSDEEAITVTVNEVNKAPVVAAISDKTVDELQPLTFTASATDPDVPANGFAFSLVGAPAGATIDATTGGFAWTPGEAQGPGVYTFQVRATDDGTPAAFGETTVKVTVNEVNVAPVLAAIGNKSVDEETALSFTATATDADVPANTLTFSLVGAPVGASITAAGAFNWTPTEAQGPGSYTFTVKVTDNGTPALADDESITVTVNEVNKAPVVAAIADQTVDELTAVSFTASATDPDVPANSFAFSLVGAPIGATIDAGTGAFSWTPTEAQGPGVYTFQVRATDDGSPPAFGETTVKITVNEVNVAPVLAAIGNKTVDEETALSFTATAADADLPANTLTYALTGTVPSGATIGASSGVFGWTPTEAQGPGSYTFTVKVTDNGTPALSDEETITVTVNEVNKAPVVAAIPDQTVDEETPLGFTASATDPDIPANSVAFSLSGAPAGTSIDPTTGVFSWTPTEAQGPGVYSFQVRATDNGSPALFGEATVKVTVREVNRAPTLNAIGNKTADEEAELTFTASATDPDLPANTLTYSLLGAPVGASINPSSGVFSWTPTEAQGPGDYTFTVKVADDGSPSLSDEEAITVHVNEVNVAPVLAAIGNKTVDEETTLSFTASATDHDIPANSLAFSLGAGAPAGASINAVTGAFTWTPGEADGPGDYPVTIRVTDNGTPVLDDFETITIHVNEVNKVPTLNAIGDKTVDEETALTFNATATDPDLPANTLTFSLVGEPAGASISAGGAFSWTPTETDGPGTYTFTVRVTDDGTPALSDEEAITVTVNEVNRAPVLAAIPAKSVLWDFALSFTASATDPDVPANTLTYSLVGAPAGAAIDPTTGGFTWTPTSAQVGPHSITVRVTDNGTPVLHADQIVSVTVEKHPTTVVYTGALTGPYAAPVTVSAILTDGANSTPLAGKSISFTLSALSTSALTQSGGMAGVATTSLTLLQNVGSYTLATAFAEDGLYLGSSDADAFDIVKADQTVSFAALGNKTFGDPPFLVNATATSGLTVGFLASGNCSVSGNSVTITGAGSCSVTAQQLGNGNYNAAPDVPRTFSIAKANQTITFAALAGKTFGDPAFTVTASASSGLGVTFAVTGNCSILGNQVSITGAGSCTATASQGGNVNYFPAPDVPRTFSIAKATPVILWATPAPIVYGTPLSGTQLNASATGVGGALAGSFNYTPAAGTVLGASAAQTLSVAFTPTDAANYTGTSKTAQIAVLYNTVVGHQFLQPINPNLTTGNRSSFKIGSTIPTKFQLFKADGTTVITTASATISVTKIDSTPDQPINEELLAMPPDDGVNFRLSGGQYIYNLGTKSWTAGTFRITATLDDGSTITAIVDGRSK